MGKKTVLIITSRFTGHGHKSITDALCEQYADMDDIDVRVLDGFEFAGKVLIKVGSFYGPLTRISTGAWGAIWDITSKHPEIVVKLSVMVLKHKFLRYLKEIKPDVIVSVHPCFVGSILDILQKERIDIPFITLIADLVSISGTWIDRRANLTLCPTDEAVEIASQSGIPRQRLRRVGFPVRSRFTSGRCAVSKMYTTENKPTFLLMSGGEGSGNMLRAARALMGKFDCYVKILAGRNKKLRRKLLLLKRQEGLSRLKVYGFVDNVQDIMLQSDIAVMRGSPNTLMEAVCCGLPSIITGALPGQEEGNPAYFENNHLALSCHSIEGMLQAVDRLLENDGSLMQEMKNAQLAFRNLHAAEQIAIIIKEVAYEGGQSTNLFGESI